jgi:hypothetical protein
MLASMRRCAGKQVTDDDGPSGHEGNEQAKPFSEVNGIQQHDQRENKLVVAECRSRGNVTHHAHGVHNRNFKQRANAFVFEGVVDDKPESRRNRYDQKEDQHLRDVEIQQLFRGGCFEAFL